MLLVTTALMIIFGRQGGSDCLNEVRGDIQRTGLWLAIILLRLTRLLCGLILSLQIFGLLPILTWLINPEGINGEAIVTLLIKVIVAVLAAIIALMLRRLINWLHKLRTGLAEVLIPGVWSI